LIEFPKRHSTTDRTKRTELISFFWLVLQNRDPALPNALPSGQSDGDVVDTTHRILHLVRRERCRRAVDEVVELRHARRSRHRELRRAVRGVARQIRTHRNQNARQAALVSPDHLAVTRRRRVPAPARDTHPIVLGGLRERNRTPRMKKEVGVAPHRRIPVDEDIPARVAHRRTARARGRRRRSAASTTVGRRRARRRRRGSRRSAASTIGGRGGRRSAPAIRGRARRGRSIAAGRRRIGRGRGRRIAARNEQTRCRKNEKPTHKCSLRTMNLGVCTINDRLISQSTTTPKACCN